MATLVREESSSDWGLSLSAMCGAVSGAFVGSVLGAEFGGVLQVVCGMLGTVLGSVSMASGWSLLARYQARASDREDVVDPSPTAS